MKREECERRDKIIGALAVISGRITDPVWACDAIKKDYPRYGDPWSLDEIKEEAEQIIFDALFPNHREDICDLED